MCLSVTPSLRATRNIGTASAIGGTPRESRISTPKVCGAAQLYPRERIARHRADDDRKNPRSDGNDDRIAKPPDDVGPLEIFDIGSERGGEEQRRRFCEDVDLLLERGQHHPENRKQEEQADEHAGDDPDMASPDPAARGGSGSGDGWCGGQNSSSSLRLPRRKSPVRIMVSTRTIMTIAADSAK